MFSYSLLLVQNIKVQRQKGKICIKICFKKYKYKIQRQNIFEKKTEEDVN